MPEMDKRKRLVLYVTDVEAHDLTTTLAAIRSGLTVSIRREKIITDALPALEKGGGEP